MSQYTSTIYSDHATSFSGKLKCTIDLSMPLNISNITQPFLMTCESPSDNSEWWTVLYIVSGLVAVGVLFILYDWASDRLKKRKRQRQRQQKEAERNEKKLPVFSKSKRKKQTQSRNNLDF